MGQLRARLEALGDLLLAAGEEADLVVVGGVAILVRGVRTRVTTDIDVIARGEVMPGGALRLVPPDPLPAAVQSAVGRVARDFGLAPDWLNTVVAKQWRQGVFAPPPGLAEETIWYVLGGLHIGIAGRRALIVLKLYAAVDTDPRSLHMQDLLALAPADSELSEAAEWVAAQDASPGFATMLEQAVSYVRANR